MQRCIIPGQSVVVGQLFELADKAFRQIVRASLVMLGRSSKRGSRAAGLHGPCNARAFCHGQVSPCRAAADGSGATSSRNCTSAVETKRVCPYSLKRQQRPLNWQTGPSVATSASSFAYKAHSSASASAESNGRFKSLLWHRVDHFEVFDSDETISSTV